MDECGEAMEQPGQSTQEHAEMVKVQVKVGEGPQQAAGKPVQLAEQPGRPDHERAESADEAGRSSDPSSREVLTELLRKAAPGGPATTTGGDPGAALALALHCTMIEAGMETAVINGVVPRHRFAPTPGWHGTYKDEWVFKYSAPGKANQLVLHCSLQRQSGRMFINATETNNLANNNQVLGLLVSNYVPDPSLLKSRDWAGIVARQDTLRAMVHEHIVQKLMEHAVDMPPSGDQDPLLQGGQGGPPRSWLAQYKPSRHTVYTVVLPSVTVAALAVAAAAVYVAMRQKRRMGAGELDLLREGRRRW